MDGFIEIFNQYARSELLVLVPVLYVIIRLLAASRINNVRIPVIITALSIVLCALYTFSTVPVLGSASVLLAMFTSVTQGILFSGASILGSIFLTGKCTAPLTPAPDTPNIPGTQQNT